MNRRNFMGSILALGIAPAIVRASSLMPIRVVDAPRILLNTPITYEQIIKEELFIMHDNMLAFVDQRAALQMLERGMGDKLTIRTYKPYSAT